MYLRKVTVPVTTDAAQAATEYSEFITGRIVEIRYVKGDFTDGVDFTITLETTGITVWSQLNVNASATVLPRQATHTTAGVAAEYATGVAVLEPIYVAHERVKIVIASGGATKSGTFIIVVG